MATAGHRSDDTEAARYAPVREANGLVFVAGISARQVDNSVPGVSTDGAGFVQFDAAVQVDHAIRNLEAILGKVGLDLAALVDVTCYLVDMADYEDLIRIWNRWFDEAGPCRTTVAVRALPDPTLRVELKAIAARAPK